MKIVFDVETTGLDPDVDDILQLSIIDGDGNVLINTYVYPEDIREWPEAEQVHHITPEMVADAPHPAQLIPKVQEIFDAADEWIAYNGAFDLAFLKYWGIELSDSKKYYDVMLAFAPYYGEWNSYRENWKWQRLGTCAAFFEYPFNAHDSFEDVKATLYCYKRLKDLEESGEYTRRCNSMRNKLNSYP